MAYARARLLFRFLAICLGGALGTAARYGIGLLAARSFGAAFPWGTLTVNVVGSFLIGAVFAFAVGRVSDTAVLVMTTGFLGGFTTYSSFNEETLRFATAGNGRMAALYVVTTVFVCLGSGLLGRAVGKALTGGAP